MKFHGDQDLAFGHYSFSLGRLFLATNRHESAIQQFQTALTIYQKDRTSPSATLWVTEANTNIALAHHGQKKFELAATGFAQVMKNFDDIGWLDRPIYAPINPGYIMWRLGKVLEDQGNLDDAIRNYTKSYEYLATYRRRPQAVKKLRDLVRADRDQALLRNIKSKNSTN